MNTPNKIGIPACRFCQHYTSEGRRGGSCSILQASVNGDWQACSVAAPFFSKDLILLDKLDKAVENRNSPKTNQNHAASNR